MVGETPRQKVRIGLGVKLAVCLVLSTAALFTVFGILNIRLHQRQSEQLLIESTDRISDIILRSTRYLMLRNDREALHHVINTIGSQPGILRIRILNEDGQVRFSTDASELNGQVDKGAEACYGCHAQSQPLTHLPGPDRARVFRQVSGERVLGLIRPIENEAACASGACHPHPSERRILGVIDTDVSLSAVDVQIGEQQGRLARFTGLAIVIACLVSVLFTWVMVHRPVKELIAGTRKVAGGDLDYRLPVRALDELGLLAESFNKMTADLSLAHAQITAWARTLEERVERKTRELRQAQGHLIANEKMASLGKLAATVAHEVNNPLAGILTYARLTMKKLEKSEIEPAMQADLAEPLRIIERESRRCGDIMKNLLTFARQAPPHREPCNLNVLIERALVLVRHHMELQGVELEKNMAADLPSIECDVGQIQQAMLVLLVNATEAMPHGGRIRVSSEWDGASDQVRVRVRDDGVGIPADVLPHIFEPFFTTKEDQQRTGLGLAVARSIVEQHGGTIGVESALEKGTEFMVALPRRAPAQAQAMAAGASPGGEAR
jgi:two-component system NtrC family sensor kinase